MGFNMTTSEAWAVLYPVLIVFSCMAIAAVFVDQKGRAAGEPLMSSVLGVIKRPTDHFLSARGTASGTTIALSFFASGMGAWIVYGTTEMGATPALSWWGVIGYSAASGFPALVLCWLGPLVRRRVGGDGFSTTDFALQRYGRFMQLGITAISFFYMFIYLVSELTSISNVFALVVGKPTYDGLNQAYTTHITIAVCAFTLLYTSVAGLPASIFTDRFQGTIVGLVVVILTISCGTMPSNNVRAANFDLASNWTMDGFMALVTLFIAICSAELFNQGSWQRVWAARDDKAMRVGFALGCFMVFLVMLCFGLFGMLAYAKDPVAYDSYTKLAYLSFFDLLAPLPKGWHVLTLVLLTTLCASSVDTLQNALAAVFSRDLLRSAVSVNWSRAIVVLVNVPAVVMAAQRYDVIALFLVADLVCACGVLPLFLGLIDADVPLFGGALTLRAPTELGAFLGLLSGFASVLVNGKVNGVDEAMNPYSGEVYERGAFAYFWLTNGDICALCGAKTMTTFIITPLVAGAATLLFSNLDIALRGERARAPLIEIIECRVKCCGVEHAPPASATNADNMDEKKEEVASTANDVELTVSPELKVGESEA
jgi:Na+/proline symporter